MESSQASLAQRLSLIAPGPGAGPRVQEEYHGYNLIAHEDRVWAMAMAAGPVDLTDSNAMETLVAEGRLLHAATVDGARATVDRTRNEGRLAELEALVAQRQVENRTATQEIDRVRQEAETANERALAVIRTLEEKQVGFEQKVKEQGEQLRALHANWAVQFARRVARVFREVA